MSGAWLKYLQCSLDRVKDSSRDIVKIKAATLYLKAVKKLRQSMLCMTGIMLGGLLFLCGLIVVHMTLLFHYGPTVKWVPVLNLLFGFIYILIGMVIFLKFFSHDTWKQIFSVNEIMEDALD
ncbi:MAG: hypothetical protein ACLFPX_01485 [Candidatus Omnitrophota bacterium]